MICEGFFPVQSEDGRWQGNKIERSTDKEGKKTTYSTMHLHLCEALREERSQSKYSPLAHVRCVLYGLLRYVIRRGACGDETYERQRGVRCEGQILQIILPPSLFPNQIWLKRSMPSLRQLPYSHTLSINYSLPPSPISYWLTHSLSNSLHLTHSITHFPTLIHDLSH